MRHLQAQQLTGLTQSMMTGATLSYSSLFASALLAATLLPAQSEALLAALLLQKQLSIWLLLAVASAGNILGSLINWWLGRHVLRWRDRRWFPFSSQQLARAQLQYQQIGYWSLLGSWLPIIGDPLTFIAGTMREPLWRFLLLVSIAKISRYLILAYVVLLAAP